jgi:hypothetical protein
MIFYAIHHRESNTFAHAGFFQPSFYQDHFLPLGKTMQLFPSISPAKSYLTSAIKESSLSKLAPASLAFAQSLEIVEVVVDYQVGPSVYSANSVKIK